MTNKEMIDALSKDYVIIPKDNDNRVKCWICGQWQKESLTRQVLFEGLPETVCLSCRSQIIEREEGLEVEAIYEEAKDA